MLPVTEMILRIFIACVLGSAIGLERQRREWTAGLRTHMLVCMGASLFMLVSMHGFADVVGKAGYGLDPSRVAAQVVSGIGFLGAGTILFLQQKVIKGLTTAAGLWTVAAVGLAVGGGMYIAATAATVMMLIILAALKPIESRYFYINKQHVLRLTVIRSTYNLHNLETALSKYNLLFEQINIKTLDEASDEIRIAVTKADLKSTRRLQIVQELKVIDGVQEVEFSID